MKRWFSPSQMLVIFNLSFLGGIALNSFRELPQVIIYELLGLACFFFLLTFLSPKALVFGLIFLGLLSGALRFQLAENVLRQSPLRNYFSREVVAEGWVKQEPVISEKQQQVVLEVSSLDGVEYKRTPGRILLNIGLSPVYHYGDRLRVIGKLQKPSAVTNFNYQGYLSKQGILAFINDPYLEKLPGTKGFWLKKVALGLKDRWRRVINTAFAYPASALFKAMFLGDRSGLSISLKHQLAAVGLIHLIAISGLHLVILTSLILVLLRYLRVREPWSGIITLFCLWAFVLMVGARPSIVRAAIMASFLSLGDLFHRPSLGIRSLVLAAVFILLINPFLLRLDVGFQLSFLAALGIIWLKPMMTMMRKKRSSLLLDLLETSLAAQILVFPLLLYVFGRASIISLLSNLLVTPLLPLLFALGFSALLLGTVSLVFIPLIQILLWPLFWYLLSIISGLSHWPGITLPLAMPWWGLASFYLTCLVAFLFLDPLRLFSNFRLPFKISGKC